MTVSNQGTPQGGPLSPLLSNILLNDFDKELEKRGHCFCRYADDCNVYVKSEEAGKRVQSSLSNFLEKLQVNLEKSAVARPWQRKFLGYTVCGRKNNEHPGVVLHCTLRVTHEDGAMSDATFTFRVDHGLKAEFANAAKAHDRTGAQLLRDFMRSYVAQQEEAQQYDSWLAKKVEQSRASAEAGNLIPASDVEARFAARRAATRARMAAPE